MSGIVGVFNLNGEPVRRETLISMCDAINHRGPHGRGVWTDGPVGLGHVLLHTTEESLQEDQPFSLDGQTWITADARIDDRASLIDLLKTRVASSEMLQEATDVALLLHSYRAWGVDCVNHLIGVFAAAIWDGHKKQLICLRDQIGIKPFYYAHTSNHFVFASEVKGILASGLVPHRIYEPRIADFLVVQLEGVDKTCTFFENVFRLPPAHRMICRQGKTTIEEYWSLDPTRESHYKNPQDYIDAFHDIFFRAVRCRLRGASPVASMLSGGLDSSSIAAVARNILEEDGKPILHTFSMVDNTDPTCAETLHINQVLSQGGLTPFNIEVENFENYRGYLKQSVHLIDDLFDINMDVPEIVYAEAHQHGITAMLDGVDGDFVMGQPGNHIAHLLQQYQIKAAIHEARCTRQFYHSFQGNTYSYLYRAFRRAFTPDSLRFLRHQWQSLRQEHRLKHVVKDSIINHRFASRIDLLSRIESLQNHIFISRKVDLRLDHLNTISHPYLVVALERYDRVASKYSIEPRHPILDRRLIEFCLALPWEQKIQDGWTKITARRSMKNLLPEKVIWRRGKEHLGGKVLNNRLPFEIASIKETIPDVFKSIDHYIDIDAIERAYNLCSNSCEEVKLTEGLKILEVQALMAWLFHWDTEKNN